MGTAAAVPVRGKARSLGATGCSSVIVNSVGRVRTAILDGKEYLVAPATTIVPGVLPGSKGPLYYPPDEIQSSVQEWDGTPIVVYHPVDALTGAHMSAQDGAVHIGELKNSKYSGKLKHELWFDAEKTKAVDKRVYDALKKGSPMELSTGLYTDNEPNEGNYKGRPYTHIARNYRPDHLAILPDQVGACSIADGCGVLVNAWSDAARQASIAARQATKMALDASNSAANNTPAGYSVYQAAAHLHEHSNAPVERKSDSHLDASLAVMHHEIAAQGHEKLAELFDRTATGSSHVVSGRAAQMHEAAQLNREAAAVHTDAAAELRDSSIPDPADTKLQSVRIVPRITEGGGVFARDPGLKPSTGPVVQVPTTGYHNSQPRIDVRQDFVTATPHANAEGTAQAHLAAAEAHRNSAHDELMSIAGHTVQEVNAGKGNPYHRQKSANAALTHTAAAVAHENVAARIQAAVATPKEVIAAAPTETRASKFAAESSQKSLSMPARATPDERRAAHLSAAKDHEHAAKVSGDADGKHAAAAEAHKQLAKGVVGNAERLRDDHGRFAAAMEVSSKADSFTRAIDKKSMFSSHRPAASNGAYKAALQGDHEGAAAQHVKAAEFHEKVEKSGRTPGGTKVSAGERNMHAAAAEAHRDAAEANEKAAIKTPEHAAAHAATMAAHEATERTGSYGTEYGSSLQAQTDSAKGHHSEAEEAHETAAHFHEQEMRSDKHSDIFQEHHAYAAQAHREAAMLHHDLARDTGQVQNATAAATAATQLALNTGWTDAARDAARAAIRAKLGKAAAAAMDATDAAQKASDAGDHAAATRAHMEAYAAHVHAAKTSRNQAVSASHSVAAEAHMEAAKTHMVETTAQPKVAVSTPAPAPMPVSSSTPQLSSKLDKIVEKEQGGGVPFMDMVIAGIKSQRNSPVSFRMPGQSVVQDMKRVSLGDAPLNSPIRPEHVETALASVGAHYGVHLTYPEFVKMAPYITYPSDTQDLSHTISRRKLDPSISSRVLNTAEHLEAYERNVDLAKAAKDSETVYNCLEKAGMHISAVHNKWTDAAREAALAARKAGMPAHSAAAVEASKRVKPGMLDPGVHREAQVAHAAAAEAHGDTEAGRAHADAAQQHGERADFLEKKYGKSTAASAPKMQVELGEERATLTRNPLPADAILPPRSHMATVQEAAEAPYSKMRPSHQATIASEKALRAMADNAPNTSDVHTAAMDAHIKAAKAMPEAAEEHLEAAAAHKALAARPEDVALSGVQQAHELSLAAGSATADAKAEPSRADSLARATRHAVAASGEENHEVAAYEHETAADYHGRAASKASSVRDKQQHQRAQRIHLDAADAHMALLVGNAWSDAARVAAAAARKAAASHNANKYSSSAAKLTEAASTPEGHAAAAAEHRKAAAEATGKGMRDLHTKAAEAHESLASAAKAGASASDGPKVSAPVQKIADEVRGTGVTLTRSSPVDAAAAASDAASRVTKARPTGSSARAAQDASHEAIQASAGANAGSTSHAVAAEIHQRAAYANEAGFYGEMRGAGLKDRLDAFKTAAAAHRAAAAAHTGASEKGPLTSSKALLEAGKAAKISKSLGRSTMSESTRSASDRTKDAVDATSAAKTPQGHLDAAVEHKVAADSHRKAVYDTKSVGVKDRHKESAEAHDEAADAHIAASGRGKLTSDQKAGIDASKEAQDSTPRGSNAGSASYMAYAAASIGNHSKAAEYHTSAAESFEKDAGARAKDKSELIARDRNSAALHRTAAAVHHDLARDAGQVNNAFTVNPFRSKEQRRFMWANHPDIAHAWAHGEHTGSGTTHRMPSKDVSVIDRAITRAKKAGDKRRVKLLKKRRERMVDNAEPLRDSHGRFTADPERQSHSYKSWSAPNGDKVELRTSTVYSKSGHQRDPSKTKRVAVVDLNGKEHKAFSVKGEGYEKQEELDSKVAKHLDKNFGIRHVTVNALDAQGGEEPAVDTAALRKADFVTLPLNVLGTNCSNCEYEHNDMCTHASLHGQPVTDRNCCAYWDAKGTLREYNNGME